MGYAMAMKFWAVQMNLPKIMIQKLQMTTVHAPLQLRVAPIRWLATITLWQLRMTVRAILPHAWVACSRQLVTTTHWPHQRMTVCAIMQRRITIATVNV